MNYKKGLFSIVAATLLSSSAVVADTSAVYLPLSTKDHDASWILFGVNGFSSGVPSTRSNGTTSFSTGMTELEDVKTDDNVATEGLYAGGDTTKPLGSLQALAEQKLTGLKIGVDIDGVTYEETEAVRSMYIKVNDSSPNVKFNYKSSLEGKKMEIMINGSTTKKYYVTISQDNTWSNAAVASEFTPTVDSSTGLSDIAAIFDANATDNPEDPKYWDKTKNLTTIANAASVTFYHFDAKSQQWKIFKNRNSGKANDFTSLEVGNAYWGRADVNNTKAKNDNGGATALILGKSGFTSQSQLPQAYLDDSNNSKLSEGWNMVAFDQLKPNIRHSATGLILSDISADDNITITDASGVYTTEELLLHGGGTATDAKLINKKIESEKLRGILPEYFNVKAFYSAANTLVLVSNEKFQVAAPTGDIDVHTLRGQDPYDVNASAKTITDLHAQGPAVSRYGEFALMMEPLVGKTSIDDNSTNGAFSQILFGDGKNADHTAIFITDSGASTLAKVEENIENDDALFTDVNATQVDTNFDGTADMLIVAAKNPFYVRDATYTRAFTYTSSATASSITVDGDKKKEVDIAANRAIADFTNDINSTNSDTKVIAAYDGDTVITSSTTLSTFDIRDAQSATVDYLKNTSSSLNLAKGAIKGVYSLSTIAKKPVVQYYWEVQGFNVSPDDNQDGVDVNISGTAVDVNVSNTTNITLDNGDSNTTGRKDFLDRVVAELNKQIVDLGYHGYASHDYTEEADNFETAKIIIAGVDVNGSEGQEYVLDTNASGAHTGGMYTGPKMVNANAKLVETLGNLSGDLVADLKFNAVYTPNYANYGPLYTMRDAGYDIKAMIKATTDMNSSRITWDSIDLTRNENDWFIQNEFNLFNVNMYAGYWVYLEPKVEKTITISNATFTPIYSYYFDLDDAHTTTNSIVGGQLKVNVEGLTDTTASLAGTASNVYAIVGGEEIQMKRNSSTVYSADITKYSSIDFKEMQSNIAFTIRATDGKGTYAKLDNAVSFDYAKPDTPTVTFPSAADAVFKTVAQDTAKMYVFKDYIPELSIERTNAIVDSFPVTNGSGSSKICSKFNFGELNTLKVVAVDGTGSFGTANVSNALEFKYISLFKGASILAHTDGNGDKAITPSIYTTDCTLDPKQPDASKNENNGVSVKALEDGKTVRIAYQAQVSVQDTKSIAWDSKYKLPGTSDDDAIVQIQNVKEYKSKVFLLEYEGALYKAKFPASESAADDSTDHPIELTEVKPVNTSLAAN